MASVSPQGGHRCWRRRRHETGTLLLVVLLLASWSLDLGLSIPVFTTGTFSFSVLENRGNASVRAALPIGTVTAAETNASAAAAFRYVLVAAEPAGLFQLDPVTGALVETAPLDREARERYVLLVGTEPPAQQNARVTVTVLDVNDNTPAFATPNASVVLSEADTRADLVVANMTASDLDDAPGSSRLTYLLRAGNNFSLFRIDAATGQVQLTAPLDTEQLTVHQLVVMVIDGGQPARSAVTTLTVTVLDANDNAPVIVAPAANSFLTVREDHPLYTTPVFRAVVTDADSGLNGQVDLAVSPPLMDIDPASGAAVLIDPVLDLLVASGLPAGQPTVLDGRSPRPPLAAPPLRVAPASFALAFTLAVTPGSSGHLMSKSTASGSRFYALFYDAGTTTLRLFYRVQGSSDLRTAIFPAIPLDDGRTHQVLLRVNGRQAQLVLNGQPAGEAVLDGLVDDCGATASDCVLLLGARAGSTSFLSATVALAAVFYRESITSHPASAADLDHLRLDARLTPRFSLLLTATDRGVPPLRATRRVVLNVLDRNNSSPVFTLSPLPPMAVVEGTPAGTSFGVVRAVDGQAPIRYSLFNASSLPFDLDPLTGELTLRAVLDREQRDSYTLLIRATDGQGLQTEAPILIQVAGKRHHVARAQKKRKKKKKRKRKRKKKTTKTWQRERSIKSQKKTKNKKPCPPSRQACSRAEKYLFFPFFFLFLFFFFFIYFKKCLVGFLWNRCWTRMTMIRR
jgi:hypothetical protein